MSYLIIVFTWITDKFMSMGTPFYLQIEVLWNNVLLGQHYVTEGCFRPWTFFKDTGVNMSLLDSSMSDLYSQLG